MRIELLKTAPDRMGRHLVRFDDGTVMKLYRQTVEDYGLYAGLELTQERYRALCEAADGMSAKMRAVRIVSAANVSRKDLEQRLVHKGEKPEQAAQAVQWMEELHLVDDAETARQVVSSCIRKGYGLSRARQALYEKRIPREYWEQALEDYPDQEEKILDFLRARLTGDYGEKEIKRAVDALLRRGHSYGTVRQALRQLSADVEILEET